MAKSFNYRISSKHIIVLDGLLKSAVTSEIAFSPSNSEKLMLLSPVMNVSVNMSISAVVRNKQDSFLTCLIFARGLVWYTELFLLNIRHIR